MINRLKIVWSSIALVGLINWLHAAELTPADLIGILQSNAGKAIDLSARIEAKDGTGRLDSYSNIETLVDLTGSPMLIFKQQPIGITNVSDGRYYEYYSTIYYDGEKWIRAVEKMGWPDHIFSARQAEITKEISDWVEYKDWNTGKSYFPIFISLSSFSNHSLLECLSDPKALAFLKMYRESAEKKNALVLNFSRGGIEEIIRLDPDKGYALISHVLRLNSNSSTLPHAELTTMVTDYMSLGSGIWIPKTAIIKDAMSGKSDWTYSFSLTDAKLISAAELQQAVKKPEISPGWRVSDKRFNIEFTVGDNPDIIYEKFKTQKSYLENNTKSEKDK